MCEHTKTALGQIDETNALDEKCAVIAGSSQSTALNMCSVQLVKGAMAAGVSTLLRYAGRG